MGRRSGCAGLCPAALRKWWFGDARYGKAIKDVTLAAGTGLRVDRIYVRKGIADFDSLTFVVTDSPQKVLKGKRFWAKLADVNKIEFDAKAYAEMDALLQTRKALKTFNALEA
jgi:hypothetical protein